MLTNKKFRSTAFDYPKIHHRLREGAAATLVYGERMKERPEPGCISL